MKYTIILLLFLSTAGCVSAQSDSSRKCICIDDIQITSNQEMTQQNTMGLVLRVPEYTDLSEAIAHIGHYKDCPTYIWSGDEFLFVSMEYRIFNERLSQGPLKVYHNIVMEI
jgi:hypothetical protein